MKNHCRIKSVTDKKTGRKLTIHSNTTRSPEPIDNLLSNLIQTSRNSGIDSVVMNIIVDGEYHSFYYGNWNDLLTQSLVLGEELLSDYLTV